MSDDEVRAAAERLLNEAAFRDGEPDDVDSLLSFERDIQTVASYALEAGQEVARFRAALAVAHNALNNCPFVDQLTRQHEHETALGAIRDILGTPPYDEGAALEAGQEVARIKNALLEFIRAYANVERLDHDGVEIELFKAWMRGCSALGIKAEGHRAALSTSGESEGSGDGDGEMVSIERVVALPCLTCQHSMGQHELGGSLGRCMACSCHDPEFDLRTTLFTPGGPESGGG